MTIPDAGLEAAIRETLSIPIAPLTTDDLATLTDLNARVRGITDLTGLDKCVNLKTLNLFGNEIVSLEPVASLFFLEKLFAGNNQIADITPLTFLFQLDTIFLSNNSLVDIAPLSQLDGLVTLRLQGNAIANVLPLAKLNNVSTLWLYDNEACDLAALASMDGLKDGAEVLLYGNPLSAFSCDTIVPILAARGADAQTGSDCDGGGLAECPVEFEGEGEGNPCGGKGGCSVVSLVITVLDLSSFDPVPGAFLTLSGQAFGGFTNANGVKSFTVTGNTTFSLRIEKPGYVTQTTLVDTNSGQSIEPVEILLEFIQPNLPPHSSDSNDDGEFSLTEVLRVVQLFNARQFHCATGATEDGFAPGPGLLDCDPHSSDYNPQNFRISLSELLRLVQLFSFRFYEPCPGETEDGFCPAL